MQAVNPKETYDVTIIGAGVAGLTAAALLAKAGLTVCVLEKEQHPGGYLAGFRRKDFRFDTAIHWLNQYTTGGMVCTLFDILGDDYPRAVQQHRIRRYKGDGFDYLLTNNPDELKRQWQQEFPDDAAGIERFFKAAKKLGHSFANFGHIFRAEETMTFWERLRNKGNLLKFALPFIPFIRYNGEQGLRKGLDKFFKAPRLQRVFGSDTELLSCLVPIGWAYYGDYQSPPEGGGQRIPEWLAHLVNYYQQDIFFKCSVREIIVENGVAKGVRFEHRGAEYATHSKYVIAACDVELLYEKLLPASAVPQKLKDKLRAAELYTSSVTISVALDCPPAMLGFNEELVHLDGVGPEHLMAGDAEKTEISILAPSHRDPTLAPAGQGTLTLFMPALMDFKESWMTTQDAAGNPVRGEAYQKLKEDIATVIIDRVAAALAPDLRKHILFYEVATPVTHWRYTGNRGGTMMGAKPGRANMQNKIAHYRTPVKNLLLGGHWAELGGGVPIAVKAAANASLLLLKDAKPAAFRILADYMDSKITMDKVRSSGMFRPYANDWVPEPTPAQKKAARGV